MGFRGETLVDHLVILRRLFFAGTQLRSIWTRYTNSISSASSAALHSRSYVSHSSSVAGRVRSRTPGLYSGSPFFFIRDNSSRNHFFLQSSRASGPLALTVATGTSSMRIVQISKLGLCFIDLLAPI